MSSHSNPDPTWRVLIVDDEEPIHVAIERGLVRLGCHVIHALDGTTGLAMVQSHAPQIVFLDLRMAGIDGHTFLRRLKNTINPAPAVVVMSGTGDMDDVVEILRAGAIDYLRKPWSPSDLVAALTRAQEAVQGRGIKGPEPMPQNADPRGTPQPGLPDSGIGGVIARLKTGESPLFAVPEVVMSLRTMLKKASVGAEEVAAKIEQDPRVAADVLKLSNSSVYARGGRNLSLSAAVTRIGFRQVYNLVETVFAQALFPAANETTKATLAKVWRRSLARAMCMRAVAGALPAGGLPGPDEAYLTGLFCDVGASFLIWIEGERAASSAPPSPDVTISTTVQAKHEEMGMAIVRKWGFDEAIVSTVRNHHAETPPSDHIAPWAVAVLGGRLANSVCEIPDLTDPTPSAVAGAERAAHELRMSDVMLGRLRDQLRVDFAATLETLGPG